MEKSKNPTVVYSVSDFIAVLNQTLEFAYPVVEVEGEVASFKVNQGKYVFFDIKDSEGSVNCFMTVWQLRMPVEDGMKVIVTAIPKLTRWGKFSLTVRVVRPSGEGAIKKSFELLKAKMAAEGLFEPERKRILPPLPKHIGVISSTDAAGYADFIKILDDRWSGVRVEVANVQVQGAGSADQIIRAVNYFNQQEVLPEVLVLIRGGGSADDLSTFNDELLIKAIAGSRIPIIVGVGHETDETLADLVADVRAATPSNAAQILVPDKKEFISSSYSTVRSLVPRMLQTIEQQKQGVRHLLVGAIGLTGQAIDQEIIKIQSTNMVLSQLDPGKVLTRGYAIIRGKLKKGEIIEIETFKDILKVEVKNVTTK